MDFFRRLGQQLTDIWNGMAPARRVVLVVAALLSFALIAGVLYWAYQPDYRPLYTNLSADDAQAIRDRLQSQNTPYRTAGDGTILVPADRVGALRVELAGLGLPGQMKGYELFDEPSLGSTPFTQNVNLLRAKQAELAKSIMQLDSVQRAKVEIARPEPSPFIRDQKATTASVLVHLKPGATLNRSQVVGIVAFVSKAVEGLTPENVTVVDNKGQLLSEPSGGDAATVNSQLDYRRALESYLASKAEGILASALGPGRAAVRITADLNFQKLKETRETFTPDGKVLKSEKLTTSTTTSSGGGARGVAGAGSNLAVRQPGSAAAAGAGGGTSTSKDETNETVYEVSRVRQELEDRLGSIERLSIAATVNLNGEDGQTTLPRAEVERLIKQAVGFRQDRGDEIQVSVAKLAATIPTPSSDEELQKMEQLEFYVTMVRNGSLAIAAVMILLIVALLLWSTRAPRPVEPAPTEVVVVAEPSAERQRVVDRLKATAQRDPEALARALTAMMEQP